MRIAAPSHMQGVFGGFGVQAADDLISSLHLPSVKQGEEQTGDIVRWGAGSSRHFANVFFTGDDGVTQVFSRSGSSGPFQVVPESNKGFTDFYGPITGEFRPTE